MWAAFDALDRLRREGNGLVTGGRLVDGFIFEGETIQLFEPRRGIWRPRSPAKRPRPEYLEERFERFRAA